MASISYYRNGTHDSKNDYYKIDDSLDGSKSVIFGAFFRAKILGHIHTHPYDADTGPTLPHDGSQGDFAMNDYIKSPIFTTGPEHITMGIRVEDQPQRDIVGSLSGGVLVVQFIIG